MAGDSRNWESWPQCLECGRPRQTICPSCGKAGNSFGLAEYQALPAPRLNTRGRTAQEQHADLSSEQPQPPMDRTSVLLLCPDCDEAFAPRFYRYCPACGCDAGVGGIEPVHFARDQVTRRTLLAIYGLLAVMALVLGYFWYLFRP